MSNFRADGNLGDYLARNNIVGLEGIDTRALVRHIRTQARSKAFYRPRIWTMPAWWPKPRPARAWSAAIWSAKSFPISPSSGTNRSAPGRLRGRMPSGATAGLSSSVLGGTGMGGTTNLRSVPVSPVQPNEAKQVDSNSPLVVALDYGMKWNIARWLFDSGCPYHSARHSHGRGSAFVQSGRVFLSNGPGDPEPLAYAQKTIHDLMGKKPIFGICLGQRLLPWPAGRKPTN